MHIRVSKKNRNGKIYEYVQLVESFRRTKDGMPSQKVLANLGPQSQQVIENLKTAIATCKKGGQLVLIDEVNSTIFQSIHANLQYLDLAVAMEMWNSWKLSDEIRILFPGDESDVNTADIIAALVFHRCVAPGSKLAAERWFPTTALSELLNIPTSSFNNTRIHRALIALNKIDEELQNRLPNIYQPTGEHFAALFLDVTDTWFVGDGPELAEMGLTKEGVFKKRIGIVLLCDERGYPIRWKVIAGKRHESLGMFDVIQTITDSKWLGETPIVCDRGMSKACYVDKLLASGVRFLTALSVNEFSSYSDKIPTSSFEDVEVCSDADALEKELCLAGKRAIDAGMERVSDNLYVLDLGVVTREDTESMKSASKVKSLSVPSSARVKKSACASIKLAQKMHQDLIDKKARSKADLGRKNKLSPTYVKAIMNLLKLDHKIQERLLAGEGENISFPYLAYISKIVDANEQLTEFEKVLNECNSRKLRKTRKGNSITEKHFSGSLTVRGVTYFNPEMFLRQRMQSAKQLQELTDFVADLNIRLRSKASRRSESNILSLIMEKLKRREMQECFEIVLHSRKLANQGYFEVELIFNKERWHKRRRYHGFVFLICSKELEVPGAKLAELYRAKDKVEKDFHIIKSVTSLRPVRHHTDQKVCAHVSLCMLALLVGRTLEQKLLATGQKYSSEAAFEFLSSCHLNQINLKGQKKIIYTITQPNKVQTEILTALNLEKLVSNKEANKAISPR